MSLSSLVGLFQVAQGVRQLALAAASRGRLKDQLIGYHSQRSLSTLELLLLVDQQGWRRFVLVAAS